MLHHTVRLARGLVAEVAGTAAAAARYTGGFGPVIPRSSRRPLDGPSQRPVLLVHGLCANKSYFRPIENQLLAAGYTVCSVNYRWVNSTIADCGRHVADDAAALLAATGADRLHLVAHSLGGVVAKWAMHHTDLGTFVVSAVSLGSPHQGAPLAGLPTGPTMPILGPLISQLVPGHPALAEQNRPLPHEVRWATVGGGLDVLVPASRARLDGQQPGQAPHTVIGGLGHIAMVTHPQVITLVKDTFAEADTRPAV